MLLKHNKGLTEKTELLKLKISKYLTYSSVGLSVYTKFCQKYEVFTCFFHKVPSIMRSVSSVWKSLHGVKTGLETNSGAALM